LLHRSIDYFTFRGECTRPQPEEGLYIASERGVVQACAASRMRPLHGIYQATMLDTCAAYL
jgi:hypothetical protein